MKKNENFERVSEILTSMGFEIVEADPERWIRSKTETMMAQYVLDINLEEWPTAEASLTLFMTLKLQALRTTVDRLAGFKSEFLLKLGMDPKSSTLIRRMDDAAEIAHTEGFESIWSHLTVDDLNETVPFIKSLSYEGHQFKVEVKEGPEPTWIDIWRTADKLISVSGDNHHIFIEAFVPTGVEGLYRLSTGS